MGEKKSDIKKWISWVVVPLVIFSILEYYGFSKRNSENKIIVRRIKESRNYSTVFLGSSHTAFAVYDKNNGVCNLAAYNEPFLFSLKKLQQLNPDTVVLSINIQNIQYNYERIFERGILSMPQYAWLMKTLSEEERKDVYSLMDFETYSFYQTKRIFPFLGSRFSKEDTTYLFGRWHDAGTKSELDTFRIALRLKEEFISTEYRPSRFQWKYFLKLCEYCKAKNIKLILLSTPLYDKFRNSIPKEEWKKFAVKLDSVKNTYRLQHLDYSDFPLPVSHFLDSDHLNGLGAPVFTYSLLQAMNK
jgi:hypothetical protein